MWPAKGHVGVRSGHPKSRRHSFPTMTGLAREVGDLVHDRRGIEWNSLSHPYGFRGEEGRRVEGGGMVEEVKTVLDRDRNGLCGRFGNGGNGRSIDWGVGEWEPTNTGEVEMQKSS